MRLFLLVFFINWLNFQAKSQNDWFYGKEVIEPDSNELVIIEHINFLNQLRQQSGKLFWSDFTNGKFIGTIVYFTDSASYFFNPEPSVLERISKYKIIGNDYDLIVLKLAYPYDKLTYIIEAVFESELGNKKNINYQNPILFTCSPVVSKLLNPTEVSTTHDWAIHTLHEYFHQYQYKQTAIMSYINLFIKQGKMLDKDSMQSIYLNNWNFKDTLIKENTLLEKAFLSTNIEDEKKYFAQFLKSRTKRRTAFNKEKKIDISLIEDFWEKIEGTSLYLEGIQKQNLHELPENTFLKLADTLYTNNLCYSGFDINNNKEYINIEEARHYFGATGYNMVRLLEKHKVDYKGNFFNFASMSLATQLKYFYKIK